MHCGLGLGNTTVVCVLDNGSNIQVQSDVVLYFDASRVEEKSCQRLLEQVFLYVISYMIKSKIFSVDTRHGSSCLQREQYHYRQPKSAGGRGS